jgi:hypothetical protein
VNWISQLFRRVAKRLALRSDYAVVEGLYLPGQDCVMALDPVSGHHHHYTPLHIPVTGLILHRAA